MTDAEQERKNRELVEALRETFAGLTKQLTPEIDPALIYVISEDSE